MKKNGTGTLTDLPTFFFFYTSFSFYLTTLFFFLFLSLCLPPSLRLYLSRYLCVGSCRGDGTHKHCGGRQEVLRNHNGVTAARRSHSLALPPSPLPLRLSHPARAIILKAICGPHRSMPPSLPPSLLPFLSSLLLLALPFSSCAPLRLPRFFFSVSPQTAHFLVFRKIN